MKLSATAASGMCTLIILMCSCTKSPTPSMDAPPVVSESKSTAQASRDMEPTWTPLPSADYPDPSTGVPVDLPSTASGEKHTVLAWNDLGMHCYQADFSRFLILPPYNVFWAQVIARSAKPAIITEGLQAHYRTLKVEHPQRHTNFWNFADSYGWKVEPGVGLKGYRTSGTMAIAKDHFIAEGVPVVDFNDDGTWDPSRCLPFR